MYYMYYVFSLIFFKMVQLDSYTLTQQDMGLYIYYWWLDAGSKMEGVYKKNPEILRGCEKVVTAVLWMGQLYVNQMSKQ